MKIKSCLVKMMKIWHGGCMDDMYTTDRKAVRKFKPVYYPDCARLSACLMPRTCDPHTHILVSKTPTVGSGLLGHFGSLIITVLLHVERTLPVFLDWYQMVMKSSSSLKYRCFFQLRDLIFLIIAPTSMAWRLSSP